MRRHWEGRTTAITVLVVMLAFAVLYGVDPTQHAITPPCPYLTLTGLACPGCGLTRAVHFLLHGDIGRAFAFNPWAFVSAPALLVLVALPAVADPARTVRARTGISWMMLVITIGFWIWRNTDSYPFTRV